MNRPDVEALNAAFKNPSCVRNVCILAHVDHGKTTIADSLLATNGIVSQRSAGQVRFLDDRPDEQERGITMKSSAVSLYHKVGENDMILNVIDTPGHVDFSTEVTAAVRICDGALIVVDLVEGVCVQTRDAIKQAHDEQLEMILILNKIDRLVGLEQKPEEMFHSIIRAIEDCNVVIAELCRYDPENDEEDLSFSPEKGNVIFASAVDGWGVTIEFLSEIFVHSIRGETADSLRGKLWDFDCYVESESRKVVRGAIQKRKENVFIQLFLKTVYYLYHTFIVRNEHEKLPEILKKLRISNPTRDMSRNCPKTQAKAIFQAWSPLAPIIMKQTYNLIPSPLGIDEKKLRVLVYGNRYYESKLEELSNCLKQMNLMKDSSGDNCIVYISKMFSTNKRNLSQNKAKVFVPKPRNRNQNPEPKPVPKEPETLEIEVKTPENVIIALGRVFGGSIKVGDEMFVLNSSEILQEDADKSKITIKDLYMVYGRELIQTSVIPCGNICGIGGLEDVVLRTATLSSADFCVPFSKRISLEPIVRNAIEPVNPKDLPKLREGLKYLTQSDSCVQVLMQESGEYVLVTAGDVHLAKCLEDLKKFIDFEITVSKPMVSLRETIISSKPIAIKATIQEIGISFEIKAIPIPKEIEEFISTNRNLIETFKNLPDSTKMKLKNLLSKTFRAVSNWDIYENKIWAIDKGEDRVNLLIDESEANPRNIFVETQDTDVRSPFDHQITSGFQMCCKAGPMCEEPLMNCAFIFSKFCVEEVTEKPAHVAGNLPLAVKGFLREAFEGQEVRLAEPLFTTDIEANVNILGKIYSVVGKRRGKILEAVYMDEEKKTFRVKAQLPVVESDGFANEIRKTTSGQANPTLRFSHYGIIDADIRPEAENEEADEPSVDALAADKLMKETRRRKGLQVDEQVVVHAEKQRTLNKKR